MYFDRVPHVCFSCLCKAIDSLTKKLHDMEKERQSQQRHIQTLQGNCCTVAAAASFLLSHVILKQTQQHLTPVIVE